MNDASEQIAVIALNALVVSIKSGETGRAFSCITDSLQQFSKQMLTLSATLVNKKEKLITSIKELKETFTKIQNDQNKITKKDLPSVFSKSESILVAAEPLHEIINSSQSVFPLIRNSMESIQYQDLIKQALNHVKTSLSEYVDFSSEDNVEKKLDVLTFNISLLELSKFVLNDLDSDFEKSISSFDNNWASVKGTLDFTESKRVEYIKEYLDDSKSVHNIPTLISSTVESFNLLIHDINNYNSEHEEVSSLSIDIAKNTHFLNDCFVEFEPIITNLKHIQILQSIEVAKNKAIISVQDIVSGMESLITSTSKSLDKIKNIITEFISNVADMIKSLSSMANEDDEKLKKMQIKYTQVLKDFQEKQKLVSNILDCFQVYPPEFASQCDEVNSNIDDLKKYRNNFIEIKENLANLIVELNEQKSTLMKEKGVKEWDIGDEKMKELITHFTITSHKESAAKLAGFKVEASSVSSPGEITLF